MTLKLYGDDEVKGWAVRYGSENATDLYKEWFTPTTYYGLDLIKSLPMLYHHGLDPDIGDEPVGIWHTIKMMDEGLWVEGQLNKRRKYIHLVKQLLEAGALGLSSGTLPHLVQKVLGEIKRWVLVETSLTPTPAEYTAVVKYNDTLLKAYQSVGLEFIKAFQPEVEVPEAVPTAVQDGNTPDDPLDPPDVSLSAVQPVLGANKMEPTTQQGLTLEDVNKAVAAAVTAALAARDAEDAKKAAADAANPTKSLKPRNVDGTVDTSDIIEVTRATKYGDFDAADMSFMSDVLASVNRPITEDAFYRELADKTIKGVNKGTLHPSAATGLVKAYGARFSVMDVGYHRAGTVKSNEVANTGQSGYGSQWSPDSWRAELWHKVRQDNVVAPTLGMIEMPTPLYELPIEGTDPTVFYLPETADLSAVADTSVATVQQTKIGTGKVQMQAKKLGLRVLWSGELNEDSIIPVLSQYRMQSIRAMQDAIDYDLLNGDIVTAGTGNINLVDSAPPTYSKYLAFDGMMKSPLVTTTANSININGSITLAGIRSIRFLMSGGYALRPRDCAIFCDDSVYAQLLALDEFITMDKAGIYATNLSGQIGVIDGMPVFPTEQMALANTAGKISATAGNNTKGRLLIAFRPGWLMGYRRQIQTEVERKGSSDVYQLILTARLCLVQFDTEVAAIGYNISV